MNDLGILFELFITFLKIGAVMFGGGYAMIPILRYEVVVRHQWLSENEFLDLIAIAESTPGPIAINSATYIGYKIGGLMGSVIASVAVVLPAFSVAMALQRFYENRYVRSVLNGIRGAVVGLVTAALITVVKGVFKDLKPLSTMATAIIALSTLIAVAVFDVDPVIAIAVSALIGLILGLLGIWLT
jgi:chromate transporter